MFIIYMSTDKFNSTCSKKSGTYF